MDNPKEQTLGSFIKEFRIEIAAYIEARIGLTRLSAYEKTAHLAAAFLFFIVVAILVSGILMFLSIALALFLGKELGSTWQGFMSVAGIYLVLGSILFLFKHRIIESIHSATLSVLMKSDVKKEVEKNERTF